MNKFSISPKEIPASLWRHRSLVATLARRDIVGRYRGSIMGITWSFFHPLLMLIVYTFVFSVVFKTRWNSGGDSKSQFALILFAGLLMFNFFSDCIVRAPSLIVTNISYVKKVVFPLEVLPWVPLYSALFHMLVSLAVWFAFYMLVVGLPSPTALLFPLAVLPLALLTIGLCWFLASLGVYLRDVSQIVGVATTALMFLSPIFFPLSSLPTEIQPWFNLNPMTIVIETARDVLIWGRLPNLATWGVHAASSAVVAWLGFAWFQKTRRGFSDVL